MNQKAKQVLVPLWVLVILFAVYTAGSAVMVRQTTGLLEIRSQDPKALLSITAAGRQVRAVGMGRARIRLNPGTYQVSANHDGKQDTTLVTIQKEATGSVTLNPMKSPKLPSVTDINFIGADTFLNRGLTAGQVQSLKRDLFQFAPTADMIVINTRSITPGPRDLSSASSDFTMTFGVDVGAQTYQAKITYAFTDSVGLTLATIDGQQVFDSASAPQ